MSLVKYKQKRKFDRTPEPKGKTVARKGAPVFVVQKHQASHLHYDFRLEAEGVLKSWAVPRGPSLNVADRRLAMMVEDHPYDYKDFEGIIPPGNYGAGTVIVWDRGNYAALGAKKLSDTGKMIAAGIKRGEIKFILNGRKLKGGFALIKIKNRFGGKDNSWLLIKEKDEYVKKSDVTKQDKSVKSGKTLEQISKNKSAARQHA